MAAHIEAKSLSAINHIAAHPPQYPVNPTEHHETLCLYISRVPGSRDVILSPFKPHQMLVTSEDVANALYYIHLDAPSENTSRNHHKRHDSGGAPRASMESARRIVRKPLPASARVSSHQTSPVEGGEENAPLGAAGSVETSPVAVVAREQLADAPDAAKKGFSSSPVQAPVARKPLGPRQMTTSEKHPPVESPSPPAHAEPAPALKPSPFPQPSPPTTTTTQKPPLLRLSTLPPLPSTDLPPTHADLLPQHQPPSPWSKTPTPFTLTLIRRDPATGHQWNVGKVRSFQTTTSPLLPPDADLPAAAYPAIAVHIETSGYARFRDWNFPTPAVPAGGEAARDMKELAAQMAASLLQQQQQDEVKDQHGDDADGGFTRQVTMAYGKSWTRNLKEALTSKKTTRSRSSTNAASADDDTVNRGGFHRRNGSASGNSTASGDEGSFFPPQHHQHEHQHQHPKGYTFTSPWGGACDFRTTSNGRALKCRHARGTTSQGFNPLVAAQALRDTAIASAGGVGGGGGRKRGLSASLAGAAAVGSSSAAVSELRFNLPATDLFHSREDRERAKREVRGRLGELLKSPGGGGGGYEQVRFDEYGDEIVDEEEGGRGGFDWSGLGRERAGGGKGGKRAKLGKLIVYEEGVKMLDLCVAANMGIWWGAWERSF